MHKSYQYYIGNANWTLNSAPISGATNAARKMAVLTARTARAVTGRRSDHRKLVTATTSYGCRVKPAVGQKPPT